MSNDDHARTTGPEVMYCWRCKSLVDVIFTHDVTGWMTWRCGVCASLLDSDHDDSEDSDEYNQDD